MVARDEIGAGPERVILVTQPYWPDLQSTSHLLGELLGALGDDPIEFTVVCGHPVLLAEGAETVHPSRERRGRVDIVRCGIPCDYKRSLPRRALYMGAFVAAASWFLLRHGRGARVCAVTNPPFAPVWIHLLSRLVGFRYDLICHDVFPEGLVALGKLKEEGWIARWWRRANRVALRGAGAVVVLGRDMARLLGETYGVPGERLVTIPHWSVADGGGGLAPEETNLWRDLGLAPGTFVVQYSGNMGLWHDLEALVAAAARLRKEKRIRFLFIGGGMRRARAEELAAEWGADNILWLPFRPEEELTDSLACCHLALISQREGLEGVAVPCKLYGILASGRGILAMVPDDSEVAEVVAEEGCGLRFDPDDAASLAAAILELSADPEQVAELGARAYAAFDRTYRLEHGVEKYRRLWLRDRETEQFPG